MFVVGGPCIRRRHSTRASCPAAVVTASSGAASLAALGLTVSTFVRRADAAPAIANLTLFPLLFLSGVFFPLANAPGWVVTLAHVFPLSHIVEAFTACFSPYTQGSGFAPRDLRGDRRLGDRRDGRGGAPLPLGHRGGKRPGAMAEAPAGERTRRPAALTSRRRGGSCEKTDAASAHGREEARVTRLQRDFGPHDRPSERSRRGARERTLPSVSVKQRCRPSRRRDNGKEAFVDAPLPTRSRLPREHVDTRGSATS